MAYRLNSLEVITEHVTDVDSFFFFSGLLLFNCGSGLSFSLGSSWGARLGWARRFKVFEELEWDASFQSSSGELLETVDDHVRNGEDIGLTDSERNGSNVVSSLSDLSEQCFRVKVENFRGEDATVVVDVEDFHTEGEGLNIQLLQNGSFGVTDLLTFLAHSEFLGNFDLTLLNLGGDVKGVEEGNLGGIQTSWARWDDDFDGSESTDLSWGRDSVAFNHGLKLMDWGVGEDETDFTLAVLRKLFDLWEISVETLSEFVVLIIFLGSFKSDVDGLLDDGVFTADHITLLLLSQGKSDLLNLVGGNVFKLNDEALVVLGEVFVKSVHNTSLLCSL